MRKDMAALESLLQDISRRCWGVHWYPEIPWYGWHFAVTGPQGAGRGQISEDDVLDLRDCCEALEGGWIIYPHHRPAWMDQHRWLMAYGGGPQKVVEETRRLERKLQPFIDTEDFARVDALLQGTMRWF